MKRLYLVLAVVMVAVLGVGSAVAGLGPGSDPDVGARELPTKLAYGDRGRPKPPDPATARAQGRRAAGKLPKSVRAPGVLPTPARAPLPPRSERDKRGRKRADDKPAGANPTPAPGTPAPVAPVPTSVGDACPAAAKPASEAAPERVDGVPAPGTYRFRQSGTVRSPAGVGRADAQVNRVYENATTPTAGVRRYDVRVTGAGLTTISTFEVDQRGIDDGVYLVSTRSSSLDALNFVPALRVRLLPLPAVAGKRWTSVGTDPLTGASMIVNGRVAGRESVNACGQEVQGWKVELGSGDAGPSLSTGPDGAFQIAGSLVIATGAGGAVVHEQMRETPVSGGEPSDRSATASQPIDRAP